MSCRPATICEDILTFGESNQTHLAHLPHELTRREETTKRKRGHEMNGASEEVKTSERDRSDGEGEQTVQRERAREAGVV